MDEIRWLQFMDGPKTTLGAIQFFSDAEICRQFMVAIAVRMGLPGPPHSVPTRVIYLAYAELYYDRSKHAKQKFSLKAGAIFEDSTISLEKWLPAYWVGTASRYRLTNRGLTPVIGLAREVLNTIP